MGAPNERGTGSRGAPAAAEVTAQSGSGARPTVPRSAPRTGSGPIQGFDGSLPPGTMLGKYQIIRQLGQGGMGAVFEAVHTGIGKGVALKTMNPALVNDPRSEERFLREAEAASRLEHPHVVGVTDFGSDQGIIYLVMELLRGEDLAGLVARAPAGLDAAFTADTMLAVCAGVFAAHESGVVHRDLKPQNIFLCHTALGEVVPKVLDFGISKMVNRNDAHSLTNSGSVMGTTHYLSPEQVQGAHLDGRSDEYALGVILYECLTGRRPHEGDSLYAIMRSISEGRFHPPRVLRPDLSPEMEAVVLRALGIRADDRYPSVHALGRALLPFASPKGRVVWTDYYSRSPGPSGPPMSGSSSRGMYAPPAAPPTVFSARGTPSDVSPVSVIRTNEVVRRSGGLRWWQVGLGAIALAGGGAAYMTFGPPRSLLDAGKADVAGVGKSVGSPGGNLGRAAPGGTPVGSEPPAAPPTSNRRAAGSVPVSPPAAPPASDPTVESPGPRPGATPAERPRAVEDDAPTGSARRGAAARAVTTRETRTVRPEITAPATRNRQRPTARRPEPAQSAPRERERRPPRNDDQLPPPTPLRGPGGAPILD